MMWLVQVVVFLGMALCRFLDRYRPFGGKRLRLPGGKAM